MSLQQATAAPPPPSAPQAEVPVTVQVTPARPRPLTREEVAAIRSARSELSSQLTSVVERRERLVEELRGAEGQVKIGLEQRLAVIDNRISQIEQDIAVTGRQLTDARFVESTATPRTFLQRVDPDVITGVSTVLLFVFLAPVALAWARMLWRRSGRASAPPPDRESSARLERIEQAVDAIAIEIERVSEAQRFQAKLLAEGQGVPAFVQGARAEEPVRRGEYGSR